MTGAPLRIAQSPSGSDSLTDSYRLSVCIPTFNRPNLLPRAIHSALSQVIPCQVIITDNGKMPETREAIETKFPDQLASGQIRYTTNDHDHAWPNWRECAAG